MLNRSVIVLVAALAIPFVASADNKKAKLSDGDLAVLDHHHHTNSIEIEMGRMGEERGSPAVKKYSAMLIKDHTTADQKAMQLAKAKGVALDERPVPAAEMSRHDEHMKKMEAMRKLEGAAFDREFLTAMVDGHTAELGWIASSMPEVGDAKLKAHLTKVKTTVTKHADEARALLGSSAVKPEAKHRE